MPRFRGPRHAAERIHTVQRPQLLPSKHHRSARPRPVVVAAAALLLSCRAHRDSDTGDSTDVAPVGSIPEQCASRPATVLVGGGATAYEPLSDGDGATIVHGPQGGWHILASARIANTLNVVSITYTIHLVPEGTSLSSNQYRVQLVAHDDCTGDYPGMYGYLDVTALVDGTANTPPELLEGRELELTLQATDSEGRSATSSVTVVGQLDAADVGDTGLGG